MLQANPKSNMFFDLFDLKNLKNQRNTTSPEDGNWSNFKPPFTFLTKDPANNLNR